MLSIPIPDLLYHTSIHALRKSATSFNVQLSFQKHIHMPWRAQYTVGRLHLYSMPERRKCPVSLTAKIALVPAARQHTRTGGLPLVSWGCHCVSTRSLPLKENDASRHLRGGGILVISADDKETTKSPYRGVPIACHFSDF